MYASYLEAYVIDYIIGNFMKDEFISKITQDMNKVSSEKQVDNSREIKQLSKKQSLLKAKESKLWDLYYWSLL